MVKFFQHVPVAFLQRANDALESGEGSSAAVSCGNQLDFFNRMSEDMGKAYQEYAGRVINSMYSDMVRSMVNGNGEVVYGSFAGLRAADIGGTYTLRLNEEWVWGGVDNDELSHEWVVEKGFVPGGDPQSTATLGNITPNINVWRESGNIRNKFTHGFKAVQTAACKDFVEKTLAKFGITGITFESLLQKASFNLYNPKDRASGGTWTGGVGYNQLSADAQSIGRTIGDAQKEMPSNVGLTIGNNVYLIGNNYASDSINAGVVIVHELLHSAGILTRPGYWNYNDAGEFPYPNWVPPIDPLNPLASDIKKHCAPNLPGG